MLKLPSLTVDLIEELDRNYPLKALTQKDIREKTKEDIAFEAGQRDVVEKLLARLENSKRKKYSSGDI